MVLALVLFTGVLAALVISMPSVGLTWDEPYYLAAAPQGYLPWFGRLGTDAFTRQAIIDCWTPVERHPPAGALWIGLFEAVAGPWLGDLLAGRLGVAVLFAALAAWLFLFMAERYGERAGLLSAACLALMPRAFGHAQIATLDVPISFAWFATVALFAAALNRSARWWPLPGLLLGLALLTKSTILPLPVLLAAWAFRSRGRKAWGPCLCLAAAAATFFLWPWMWVDTLEHLKTYLAVMRTRPSLGVHYFGHTQDASLMPWHYPLVMTLGTTPVAILACAVLGARDLLRRGWADPAGMLVLLQVPFILVLASVPGIPKYDGTRLFLPMFPFLAALAGLGLSRLLEKAARLGEQVRSTRRTLAAGAFVLFHAAWLWAACPFYLSTYSGGVGGLPGAERLGLETTFWLEAVDRDVVGFLNLEAPAGARLAVTPYAHLWRLYHEDHGTFREDLRLVDRGRGEEWDVLVLVCRKGMFDQEAWRLYGEAVPWYQRSWLGVPLCRLYRRDIPSETGGAGDRQEPRAVDPGRR